MKLRILSVFAAAALLAACETAPDSSATSAGEGVSTTNQPSSTSSTLSESSPEWFAVNVGDRVFFGFDKYDLSGEARRTLELQSAWLKKYPQYKVVVEGHADERGTREYNLALGERRANSVKITSLRLVSIRHVSKPFLMVKNVRSRLATTKKAGLKTAALFRLSVKRVQVKA